MTTLTKNQFLEGLKHPEKVILFQKKNLISERINKFYTKIQHKVWKYSMKYNDKATSYEIQLYYNLDVIDRQMVDIINDAFPNHNYYKLNIGYTDKEYHRMRIFWINL